MIQKMISKMEKQQYSQYPVALHQDRPGVLLTLTTKDKEWLNKRYPQLSLNDSGISGILEFTAVYDDKSGSFFIIEGETGNKPEGTQLSGKFKIELRERSDTSLSRLPALFIEGIDPIMDRHFNQRDKIACLCSPFEEEGFLIPEFRFAKFLEELVIPFLYGQAFYSANGHWPWSEYAHGATGLFESYFKEGDSGKANECVRKLSLDKDWGEIKSVLGNKSGIKGHLPCFCEKADFMRRCHPNALNGLRQLWRDIRDQKITLVKREQS